MQLDEQTRARLRALAEDGGGELDDAARSRIARRVAEQGPRVLRRARHTRAALSFGGVALVVGLAGVATPWLAARMRGESAAAPVDRDTQAVAPGQSRLPAAGPGAQGAAARAYTPPAERACEQREAATADGLARDGGRRYALGALGSVVAAQGSAVVLDAGDPCRVLVRLDDGRVDVHAADLGGGELRVVTPRGEVIVHGTVFAVEQRASALTVDVDEGRVSVSRPDGQVLVDAGRRVRLTREGAVEQESLTAGDRARLRAILELDAHANESMVRASDRRGGRDPLPSADSLVAEADALWRAGDLAGARDRYRRAGAFGGATGEAAWLALARRELSAERPSAARAALASYHARFPRGKLAAEALGIEFRAALQQNDLRAARRIAQQLQRSHRDTPQAQAAARWSQGQPLQGGR